MRCLRQNDDDGWVVVLVEIQEVDLRGITCKREVRSRVEVQCGVCSVL